MAQFSISFQASGTLPVDLPVVALDSSPVLINGLDVHQFHFSVQNILLIPLTFNISSVLSGNAANKLGVTFDNNPLTIDPGVIATVTATLTPTAPMLEGDLVSILASGTQI